MPSAARAPLPRGRSCGRPIADGADGVVARRLRAQAFSACAAVAFLASPAAAARFGFLLCYPSHALTAFIPLSLSAFASYSFFVASE
eukprot:6195001-Pleurochrysis_carterae.AAC.1